MIIFDWWWRTVNHSRLVALEMVLQFVHVCLLPPTFPQLVVDGAASWLDQGLTSCCLIYFSYPIHSFHVCHPFVDFPFSFIFSVSLNTSPTSTFNLHTLLSLWYFSLFLSLFSSHTILCIFVCFNCLYFLCLMLPLLPHPYYQYFRYQICAYFSSRK